MNANLTKRLRSRRPLLLGIALLTLSAAPAAAQDDEPDAQRGRARLVTVGGGVQAYPLYPGAEDLGINPMPVFDTRREGQSIEFEAPDEGWGFGLFGRDARFNIGPAIQFQGKRDEDDVGAAVGNVGFTIEAGAFVEAYVGENFRLRAEGRRGLGGHDGWVGDLGADLIARDGDRTIFSIGPRLRLGDDNYMDAYFGVTPVVAARTGLPAFDPQGGVFAVGGTAGLRHQFGSGERWGVHIYARYDRLVGDPVDSPIVSRFGSVDQYSGGIGLSYTFRIGRRR